MKNNAEWLMEHLSTIYEKNPYLKLLDIHITKLEEGYTEMTMPIVADKHTNLYGIAHGGALASLADTIMGIACATVGKKVVTLAGDTHNAWQGELKSSSNKVVGIEIATSSVSSPGLETYLGIGGTQLVQFEQALNLLIDDLEYSNLSKRGYLKATFSATDVKAEWFFATTVFEAGAAVNLEKTITKS